MTTRIYTASDKLKAVEREIGFRHRVYDRKVDEGRMKPADRDEGIAIMEAIAADYRALAEKERLL